MKTPWYLYRVHQRTGSFIGVAHSIKDAAEEWPNSVITELSDKHAASLQLHLCKVNRVYLASNSLSLIRGSHRT